MAETSNHLDVNIQLPDEDTTTKYGLDTEVKIGNDITLSAQSIHLKKEIYKPGCLEMEFVVKPTGVDSDLPSGYLKQIKDHFYPGSGTYYTITVKRVDTSKNETDIATDYVVRDVKVRRVRRDMLDKDPNSESYTMSNESVLIALVKAYSPDYFLTLDKYCQMYRGKKLSEIIRDKIKGDTRFKREITQSGQKVTIDMFPVYEDLRLCHTTKTYENKYPLEMLQPYLVQYNESFHDFVVRVANRCGELFYYENGKLLLGLDKDNLNPVLVPEKDVKTLQDRDKESYTVYEFVYNNKNNKEVNVDIETQQDLDFIEGEISLLDESDITSADNVSKYLLTSEKMQESSSLVRDENVGMDEFLRDLSSDDSIDKSDVNDPHWFEIAHEAFKADGIASFFTKAAVKAMEIPATAALLVNTGLKSVKDGTPVTITDSEITDYNCYSTDTGSLEKKEDKYKNFTNVFYSWIDKKEKTVSAKIQTSHREEISANDALLLGQFVKISGLTDTADPYFISAVELNIETIITECNAEYTPDYSIDLNIQYCPLITDSIRNTGITYQTKVFPPLAEIPHIRKAEPQQAAIVCTKDPLRNGRVQIRYPWQPKDEGGRSPWLMVATPFTGEKDSGVLFTPDEGDYVMINYEGGNIERPYVDGSLFHSDHGATNWGDVPMMNGKLNYRNPHNAITRNGNGITFVDGDASWFIGGMLPSLVSCAFTLPGVGKDCKRLGGGMILSDYYGMYSIAMSSAGRTIDINSPWGSVNINAFTGITLDAPNGDIKISGKNVTIEAGNKVTITSGKNIKGKEWDEVGKILGSVVGGLGGSMLKSAMTNTINIDPTKLLDVSFLRSIYEIWMRPVDGSLMLTSKRNLMMQAGQGKVTAPASTLSDVSIRKKSFGLSWNPVDIIKQMFCTDKESDVAEDAEKIGKSRCIIGALINVSYEVIDSEFNKFKASVEGAVSGLQSINDYFYVENAADANVRMKSEADNCNTPDKFITLARTANSVLPTIENLFSKANENNYQTVLTDNLIIQRYELIQGVFEKIKNLNFAFDELCKTSFGQRDHYRGMTDQKANGFDGQINTIFDLTDDVKKAVLDDLLGLNDGNLNDRENALKYVMALGTTLDDKITEAKKRYKRAVFWAIVNKSSNVKFKDGANPTKDINPPITQVQVLTDNNNQNQGGAQQLSPWQNLLISISGFGAPGKMNSGVSSFVGSALSAAGLGDIASYDEDKDEWSFAGSAGKLFNINGVAGPRTLWDGTKSNGQILLSSNNDTYQLNPSEANMEACIKKVTAHPKQIGLDDLTGLTNKL